MVNTESSPKMKRYFDAVIVAPLEEEFEIILQHFDLGENLTNDNYIRFVASVPGCHESYLVIKQAQMGRTANAEAISNCLSEFDVGVLICLGIAGGLSGDVSIGDVCYTGTLIDVLDNLKVSEPEAGGEQLSLAPTHYDTPRALGTPIALDRVNPSTKPAHEAWIAERGHAAEALIPGDFTGRNGNLERVKPPRVWEGAIVCGWVSDSPTYNAKLRAVHRKVLALETESGAMFSIAAYNDQIPAISIRGISDYAGAGINKNKFEEETNFNARKVAVLNATTFLIRQLSSQAVRSYLYRRRDGESLQPSLLPLAAVDRLEEFILKQDDDFYLRLRDLSPAFALFSKGYRLPLPRLRIVKQTGVEQPSRNTFADLQDALQLANVMTLHIPREYPDSSIAWIIARNLLATQSQEKQLVPCVLEAKHIRRPHIGIDRLAGSEILSIEAMEHVQLVYIINDFDFSSTSRSRFLRDEVKNKPDAKFIFVSRSPANLLLNSEFSISTVSITTELTEISFSEMSHFVQKNFELDVPAAEVIAARLQEIFQRYKLFAHPSYFVGIPRNILNSLLQANRRAELIELAVAGYLSFVVAEDREPIALSRTTREKFLTELSFYNRVKKTFFSEGEVTQYVEKMAKKYDFNISPARFVNSFIDKGILHTESGKVVFTLNFMENYLLAKRLIEEPSEALLYFDAGADGFDYGTFALYAEMGAAPGLIQRINERLDEAIRELGERRPSGTVMFDPTVTPAFLDARDRLEGVRKRLEQAENDIRNDRDQTRAKQAILDLRDRLHDEAASRLAERATAADEQDNTDDVGDHALRLWIVAVLLLGSGAERLEARGKRELIGRIVRMAELLIDVWTRIIGDVNFAAVRDDLYVLLEKNDPGNLETRIGTPKQIADLVIGLLEYLFLSYPFKAIMTFMCEEARYNVLVESIKNSTAQGVFETLIRDLWVADIDPVSGRRDLRKSVRELPKTRLVRYAIADQLASRVYWKHWQKEGRLILLEIANESLKGIGRRYERQTIEELANAADADETAC